MRFGLFLILLFLASGCAQVGELSGGPQDTVAPIPDSAKMLPLNETKNFSGKQWIIPFNEFISLNNPVETMVVLPPNIKPKAQLKGKKLVLTWDEELSPNTTYAFYLNGTVQDVTEKNDSLMTFVFSTGDFIDSLYYENRVVDAVSGQPLPKYTLALYRNYTDSTLPEYVGQSNRTGLAKLSYLKPGSYQAIAFEDLNRNLKPDINESFGFLTEPVLINDSIKDSLVVRVYPPATKPKINKVQYIGQRTTCISANNLLHSQVTIDGELVQPFHSFSKDSALFLMPQIDSSRFQVVVKNEAYSDTAKLQISKREKEKSPQVFANTSATLRPSDSVYFYSTSPILSVDLSKVYAQFVVEKDTISSNLPYLEVMDGKLTYTDYARTFDEVRMIFEPGALSFESGSNADTLKFNFVNKTSEKLGVVILRTLNFPTAHVVEMIKDGKVIDSFPFQENGEVRLPYVMPAEYSFRVLMDRNGNGAWDRGEFSSKTQPEEYIQFKEVKKIRASWEMEIELNYAQ
ncbi:MAG: Ig-like domain-containing protein [Crocinitomicaceae bacterium]|jgi:uncharacterized protein (DUF2141 family)|nr:Ig-like domain-containing protein [Crocinitomicaceae bacterium]